MLTDNVKKRGLGSASPEQETQEEGFTYESGGTSLEGRLVHPGSLFHLLWQRDRLRCPFGSCHVADTVVLDASGEAVHWFFTSKREGTVKRKLSSNMRRSCIFQDFTKDVRGPDDPVAVLIAWPRTHHPSQVDLKPCATWPESMAQRVEEQKRREQTQWVGGGEGHRCWGEGQPAMRHLTSQELHAFLF
ncbi:unnamed protein product, partial [Discosporangium mesarthrocarpum]